MIIPDKGKFSIRQSVTNNVTLNIMALDQISLTFRLYGDEENGYAIASQAMHSHFKDLEKIMIDKYLGGKKDGFSLGDFFSLVDNSVQETDEYIKRKAKEMAPFNPRQVEFQNNLLKFYVMFFIKTDYDEYDLWNSINASGKNKERAFALAMKLKDLK